MLVFVTIPLVVVGPSLIAALWCERLVVEIQITYSLLVGLAAASVAATAFRNPGILERHDTAPDETWTWNDQAQTFKPPSARYCPWCNCVVVGFDHTCPWMGTAIGKNNLYSFRCFVFVVQILAYYTAAVFLLGSFGVAQRK